MKQCQCCGEPALSDVDACSACGESSWSLVDDAPAPEKDPQAHRTDETKPVVRVRGKPQ